MEDHLLVQCAIWNGQTDLSIATTDDFDPREHFDAQLAALAAVGLLADAEVAEWRRRFYDFGEEDEDLRIDDALRERVERYLTSLLPRSPEDDAADPFLSAVGVLEELGVLTEEESGHWYGRLAEAEGEEEDDDEDDDFWTRFDGRELRRVLLGPAEEISGVRITSVEVYGGGVMVRWNTAARADDDDFFEPHLGLSDDAGTDYDSAGGSSGSGGGERMRGESTFVPTVPDGAKRLYLDCGGRPHAFELGP